MGRVKIYSILTITIGDMKMKIINQVALLSTLTLAALTLPGTASAFSTNTCLGEKLKWNSNTVSVRTSNVSFPVGSVWRGAISEAVQRVNQNPSKFRYSFSSDSGGVKLGNGQNEIWGTTDNSLLNGAPAVAFTWWSCYWFFGDHVHMKEVDIVFDYRSPWKWTASTNKSNLLRYGGNKRPMQTTAAHELGHGLKLNHVNYEYNVMGTDFEHIHVNGNTARAYFGEDTADASVYLYGLSYPLRQDLGVVHWRYDNASGAYSNHRKTRVFNSAGTSVLASYNDNGETRFYVNPGQQVKVEFTYENNGASTLSGINVGFYISTNSTISTWDRRIGGRTLTLSRANVYTQKYTVTIPTNLNSGQKYWLGVVIDENNNIGEMAEWNNATYLPIRVN
jgi:CARDB protein